VEAGLATVEMLLRVVGDVVAESGQWPVYQYVDARMDDAGLDADAVLRSMPSITHSQLNNSLVRRGHSTPPETPVKLTIAGFAQLPEHAELVDMFLAVLNELANRRAEAAYDPAPAHRSRWMSRRCSKWSMLGRPPPRRAERAGHRLQRWRPRGTPVPSPDASS
jgi:hypothetical protein